MAKTPSIEQSGNTIVADTIRQLLGRYWTSYAQHRMHIALLRTWGLEGLAQGMDMRTRDEPQTINALSNRLLDLGGDPGFTLSSPNIGKTLRGVLENDMQLQAHAKPALNAAAEAAAAAHDATSRVLFEGILADEEEHFYWLETELKLLELMGEPLYVANRLHPPHDAAAA